jgi:predicted transcriptional regulator
MSVHYTSAVWRIRISDYFPNSRAASTIKLVLLKIADHANDEGIAYPSIARIAQECELQKRWTMEIIAMLENVGLLEVIREEGKINHYRIILPESEPVRPGAPVRPDAPVEPVRPGAPVRPDARVPVRPGARVPVRPAAPEPSYNRHGTIKSCSSFNDSHTQKSQSEPQTETIVERVARIMNVPAELFPLQADSYLRRYIKPEHTDDQLREVYGEWCAKGHDGIENGRVAYWWVKWLNAPRRDAARASPEKGGEVRVRNLLNDPEYIRAVMSVEVVDESTSNA